MYLLKTVTSNWERKTLDRLLGFQWDLTQKHFWFLLERKILDRLLGFQWDLAQKHFWFLLTYFYVIMRTDE